MMAYNTTGSFTYNAVVGHHQLASDPLYAEINGDSIKVHPSYAQKIYRPNAAIVSIR